MFPVSREVWLAARKGAISGNKAGGRSGVVKGHVRCMTDGEWWEIGRVLNMLYELSDGDPVKV
jgi:hypothetical protein